MALIVQEHLIKLGGKKLSGQIKSIDITETATIQDVKDSKGKTKANQPTGYEGAKITIEFIIEDSPTQTQLEQLIEMQRLFKAHKQTKAKLLTVYNEDCAARSISKVYFEKLTSKNVIGESGRTATLELRAPKIAGIKLKTAKQAKAVKKKTSKALSSSKGKKNKNKSPANKKKSASAAKKKAKNLKK